MSDTRPVFACDLGALSADEQARRSALASRVAGRVREVLEISDGYAVRLDPDPAILRDALDWLGLERRCCPFLRLQPSCHPSDRALRLRSRAGPRPQAV